MSNVIDLAEYRERLSPFVIALSDGTEVVLPSLKRLPPDRKAAAEAEQQRLYVDIMNTPLTDVDELTRRVIASAKRLFPIVAESHSAELLAELGDDGALIKKLIDAWGDYYAERGQGWT